MFRHSFTKCTQLLKMPSNEGLGFARRTHPYKVLVLGGSYGGLGAALNLWDLCNGRSARFSAAQDKSLCSSKIPVDITIVDERDGYCESNS